jgi:hypothetical protein
MRRLVKAAWAALRVAILRCRYCDNVWQVREPHMDRPPR